MMNRGTFREHPIRKRDGPRRRGRLHDRLRPRGRAGDSVYEGHGRLPRLGTPLVVLRRQGVRVRFVSRLGREGNLAPRRQGFIAESFERIHRSNLIAWRPPRSNSPRGETRTLSDSPARSSSTSRASPRSTRDDSEDPAGDGDPRRRERRGLRGRPGIDTPAEADYYPQRMQHPPVRAPRARQGVLSLPHPRRRRSALRHMGAGRSCSRGLRFSPARRRRNCSPRSGRLRRARRVEELRRTIGVLSSRRA